MKHLSLVLCLLPVGVSASEYWRYPNSEPCQVDDVNLCWTTDYLPQSVVDMVRFDDDEVCDGDVVSNSGVREGKPFTIDRQVVFFDRDYMDQQGIYYQITDDNRACIHTLSNGVWHYVFECGNRVRMLQKYIPLPISMPVEPRREPLSALLTQVVGGYRTTTQRPLLPQYTGSEEVLVYLPYPEPNPEPEPIAPVPLPASVWLMIGAIGCLFATRRKKWLLKSHAHN